MRADNIKLFLEKEEYDNLLFSYRETFIELEKIKDNLCLGYYFHSDIIQDVLGKTVGYYGDVILPTALLDSHINTLESKSIMLSDFDKVSIAKKTATFSTDSIRKTYRIFKAYSEMADKFVGVFQSMLKSVEREHQADRRG